MMNTNSIGQSRSYDTDTCHAILCVCSVTLGLNLEDKFLLVSLHLEKSQLYDFRKCGLQGIVTKNVHRLYMECYYSLLLSNIRCNNYYIQYKECYYFLLKGVIA